MIVYLESHHCSYLFRPVSDRHAKAICKDVAANGGPSLKVSESDNFAALIGEDDLDIFSLSPSQRRDLQAGWTVRFRLDDWTARQVYGYSSS